MARLQDFQQVTPSASDNILIVQAQGQGLAPHTIKMDSTNPKGTGSLSLNRASGSTVGANSVAVGNGNTASGESSFAEGRANTASGIRAHAEGSSNTASGNYSHAEGAANTSSGDYSHAEGGGATSSGEYSHAEGSGTTSSGRFSHSEGNSTIANHRSQHVFGELNIADASTAAATAKGNYIEIVGNGTSTSNRSNARTLDWSGNEVLAGDLTYKNNVSLASMLMSYSLSSSSSVTLTDVRYTSLIILGFAQGIGDVAILLTVGSGSITSTINMKTGAAFSSSHLTFSLSGQTLTISSDVAQASILTIIRGN